MMEAIYGAVGGVLMATLVPMFIKKTIGTRYVTEKECDECNLKKELSAIRKLVVELAIKAGVPAHEVAKVVGGMP